MRRWFAGTLRGNIYRIAQRLSLGLVIVIAPVSCEDGKDSAEPLHQCSLLPFGNSPGRDDLLLSFDPEVLFGLAAADVPDQEGALGRNQSGYFHVRFQLPVSTLSDYAVTFQDIEALEYTIRALEYSFDHQLPAGDFSLVVPPELSHFAPGEIDLASGTAFFLSSVGLTLHNLEGNPWFNAGERAEYKSRVEALRPKVELAAQWLTSKRELLENADGDAPNRLFFDALAFYGLGLWLNDTELKTKGIAFAELAIDKQHSQGYFLEGGGWDSSYQGVAINVGFNLYSILDSSESAFAGRLAKALSCAADWQQSRVLATGEISAEGNTRVFPGGETFLGQEKAIDWTKTMVAMYMMGYYSGDETFLSTADRIRLFYNG